MRRDSQESYSGNAIVRTTWFMPSERDLSACCKTVAMNSKRPSKTYPPKLVASHPKARGSKRTFATLVIALIFVVALLAVGLAISFGSPTAKPPAKVFAASQARELSLELGDMFVKPRTLTITQGDSLKLVIRNKGSVNHDLTFSNGQSIRQLKPGEQDTIDFGVLNGALTAICTLPGHSKAGMKFAIYVTEP
jgi:nitrite reductase (NO-forming)